MCRGIGSTLSRFIPILALALLLSTLSPAAHAAGLMWPVSGDGSGNGTGKLEILEHKVNVVVENGYAITTIDQVFANRAVSDLEAIYRFPVPDKAAVSEFTVWVDGAARTAEVFEKQAAREIYAEEKAAGRDTGLAEKNKHYNFEIRVYPVRAQTDTKTRLVYIQPVNVDTGIGRFVYPLEDGGTDDLAALFWTADSDVKGTFSFDLQLRTSAAVSAIRLPAQPGAAITRVDPHNWNVSLAAHSDTEQENTLQGKNALDQDIVVYWRLEENTPASVDLVSYKPEGRDTGTFMLTLNPGDDLASITEGRDWVFVLDLSGSMARKHAILTDGVRRALGNLRAQDRFRIIGFNDSARELTRGWQDAGEENIRHWINELDRTRTSGGTNLFAGTESGLKALDRDRTSAIIMVTDGEANVGTVEKKQFLNLLKRYDVRLFTAVMGNSANRPLLESMSTVSNGFSVSVSNSDDIVGKLMEFTSKATHYALHDIKLDISGTPTFDLTSDALGSLYRGEQLTVFGRYRTGGPVTVTLRGKVAGETKTYSTTFDLPAAAELDPEIERLWAYASIRNMQDMIDYLGDDSEYKSAITDLAVSHGLITNYTSMVMMHDEQFAARGLEQKNNQRRKAEVSASQARSAQAVRPTRVDSQTPAFNGNRASYNPGSGGGAFGLLLLLMLPGLQLLKRKMSSTIDQSDNSGEYAKANTLRTSRQRSSRTREH